MNVNRNEEENDVNTSLTSDPAVNSKHKVKPIVKRHKVAAVIFFKVNEEMKDQEKLNKYVKETSNGVKIEEVKMTANIIVMIYTNSSADNETLMRNQELFKGLGRLDLNTIDKTPYVLVKNMTYNTAIRNVVELRELGIKGAYEMTSKHTGHVNKMIKAAMESEERKTQLLNMRYIIIENEKYYVEEFMMPPIQCRRCKGFEHVEKICKNKFKCGKCSKEHKEEECNSTCKSANCSGEHSTFYRGCPEFTKTKNEKLEKYKDSKHSRYK